MSSFLRDHPWDHPETHRGTPREPFPSVAFSIPCGVLCRGWMVVRPPYDEIDVLYTYVNWCNYSEYEPKLNYIIFFKYNYICIKYIYMHYIHIYMMHCIDAFDVHRCIWYWTSWIVYLWLWKCYQSRCFSGKLPVWPCVRGGMLSIGGKHILCNELVISQNPQTSLQNHLRSHLEMESLKD